MESKHLPQPRPWQRTLASSFSQEGRGVHTGAKVSVTLRALPAGSGIQLLRSDLDETSPTPARLPHVCDTTQNNTTLSTQRGTVSTVEHLLAALTAVGIDNCLVEVSGPEMPILDGSSQPWLEALARAGWSDQDQRVVWGTLQQPVVWSQGGSFLAALPASHYRISYTLSYPLHPYLRAQFWEGDVHEVSFKEQLAAARTFCLWEDLEKLRSRGLIAGGTLDNGLVIRGMEAVNPEGFRYPDEPVRHKVLDLVGDLSLLGGPLAIHVVSLRSGHQSNVAFARELASQLVWCEEPRLAATSVCV